LIRVILIKYSFLVFQKGRVVDRAEGPSEEELYQLLKQNSSSKNFEENNARIIPVTEQVSFAPQLSTQQLQNLNAVGVTAVINLRTIDEEGFNHAEEELLKSKGTKYALIPVSEATDMDIVYVNKVREKILEFTQDGNCLVHCKVGLCACIAVLLSTAKDIQAPSTEVFSWAQDMGFNLANHPKVYNLVKEYLSLNHHQRKKSKYSRKSNH